MRCDKGQCYYKDTLVFGVAQVMILPPTNVTIPFLPYRVDGKSICGLCVRCMESNICQPCKHSVSERAIVSVYTLAELAFAETVGYKIIRWYEVYAYKEAKPIFKQFLQILGSYKIRNSGFPPHVQTFEEKLSYCDGINQKMQFYHEKLQLSPNNVQNNRQLRDAFKLGSNSLLGKLSQNADMDKDVNLSSQDELDKLFYHPNYQISDFFPLSDYVIQAKVKTKAGYNKPNLTG